MAVTDLEITSRTSFVSGESFGDVGPYELLEGTAYIAVDPLHARNQGITDLNLAPRNSAGRVEFSSDFAMLQPVNADRGNRRILFDVVNRGRKTALTLNSVPMATDHTAPLQPGNGYLMRRGYTVVWGGWQADVPPTPGLIGLQVPEAVGPQGPLNGKIMCQFQGNEPTQVFLLADRDHLPNPAADPRRLTPLSPCGTCPTVPPHRLTAVNGHSFVWRTRTLSRSIVTYTCHPGLSPEGYTSWSTLPTSAASWASASSPCGMRCPS